jgi:hypothetical protein
VVRYSGDAIGYARSLTRLERLRQEWPTLSLGSADGSLLERIRRLVIRRSGERVQTGYLPLAIATLAVAVLLVVPRESARATHRFNEQPRPQRLSRVAPVQPLRIAKVAQHTRRRRETIERRWYETSRRRVIAIHRGPAPVEMVVPEASNNLSRLDSLFETPRNHNWAFPAADLTVQR